LFNQTHFVSRVIKRKINNGYDVYRRDPQSLVKPMKVNDENDENKYNEKFEAKKAKAVRHILLIRHGQYHTDGKTDIERMLTELGRMTFYSALK